MTDVFISYKREDESRVTRLVSALEKSGLSVWWDRSLPGAENWREGISKALEESKCTVVVWTQASAGNAGTFVRDEASHAAKANRLVPVCLDRVDIPLGFGELQAIDLTRWKGRVSDPFFQDLVAAIKAKINGQPVPKPNGPLALIRRRVTFSALVAMASILVGAFTSNTLKLQDRLCEANLMQPTLSDACGALGLGASPKRKERLAWERRTPGSCADLRKHLAAFEKGVMRDQARALLDARTVSVQQSWRAVSTPMPLRMTVPAIGAAQRTDQLARADAQQRGAKKGEQLCKDADTSGVTRLRTVTAEPQEWSCDATREGHTCGFEGRVLCFQEELIKTEQEQCGSGSKS